MAQPTGDSEPIDAEPQQPATLREAFADAVRNAGIGQVAPGEIPTAASLLKAIGGVRGLVEAILPGLGFLVLYATTKNVAVSVLFPVAVSLVFVVIRLVGRTPATQALAGVAGVAVSAVLALLSGRAEDNFIPGILINAGSLLVILVSLAVRYPLIGLIVGVLSNEGLDWRKDKAKRRVLTLTTALWAGLFATRLIAELPLYYAGEVELLGGVKLVLGVPFYAGMLWVTWLLVRSVYGRTREEGRPRP